MKKCLLDTNIFLWWLNGDKKLKKEYVEIINDPSILKYLSVVSIWEIIIKVQAKKLPLSLPIEKILENFEFNMLNIELSHILRVAKLPKIHKDPFDRLIVAQAKIEDCLLLSSDKLLKRYF